MQELFQDRYNSLKRVYEQRIESLQREVAAAVAKVTSDKVSDALGSDPATAQFVQERAIEVVGGSMAREREAALQRVADQLASRESALRQASSELASTRERLRLTVDQGEREIAALTDELEAEAETREDLEAALDALEAEKAAGEAKHREREELHEREKQEMRDALDELKAGLDEAAGKGGGKGGGQEDASAQHHIRALEARVEAHERQLQQKDRHLDERDKQLEKREEKERALIREVGELKLAQSKAEGERQRLSEACTELRNDKARLEAAKDELARQHRHVCDDVRKMEALLEQSEGERLELRTKYISVGEKVEELLQTEARESSAAIAQLRQQAEELKRRVAAANKSLKDRGRAARAAVRERDAQIKALEDEVDVAKESSRDSGAELARVKAESSAAAAAAATSETSLRRRLEATQRELAQAQKASLQERKSAAEETKRVAAAVQKERARLESRSARLEGELRDAQDHERKRLGQWEKAQQDVALRQQEKMRDEMQADFERRLQEIAAEKAAVAAERAGHLTEGQRVRAQVANEVEKLNKGMIPLTQHEQVLDARLAELKAEHAAEKAEMSSRFEESVRLKLRDVEERKSHEYSMAMVQVRQGIKKLETSIEEERGSRQETEQQLRDERASLVALRHRAEEGERQKAALVTHLEEASRAIGRLKGMHESERSRREELEREKLSVVKDVQRRDSDAANMREARE